MQASHGFGDRNDGTALSFSCKHRFKVCPNQSFGKGYANDSHHALSPDQDVPPHNGCGDHCGRAALPTTREHQLEVNAFLRCAQIGFNNAARPFALCAFYGFRLLWDVTLENRTIVRRSSLRLSPPCHFISMDSYEQQRSQRVPACHGCRDHVGGAE